MDISIIEFLVYALIGYSGIIVMIVSVLVGDSPSQDKAQASVRVIWLVPSIICLSLLAQTQENIFLDSETITSTETKDFQVLNSSDNIVTLNSSATSITTETRNFTLMNPMWVLLHYMFSSIIIIYVITQILNIFTKLK